MTINFHCWTLQGPLYSIDGDGEHTLVGSLVGGYGTKRCGGIGFAFWTEIFLHLDWIRKTMESEGV